MSCNITENEIKNFLKNVLSVECSITLNEFINRLSQAFKLSEYDKSFSKTRPLEPMYEQRVRNLISHNNLPDGVIYENETFILIR